LLQQLKHRSAAGQLLLVNVQMLAVDLDAFNGEQLIEHIDKYIQLQDDLLKQASTDLYHVLSKGRGQNIWLSGVDFSLCFFVFFLFFPFPFMLFLFPAFPLPVLSYLTLFFFSFSFSHSYKVDHTVLPFTQYRCTCPFITPT